MKWATPSYFIAILATQLTAQKRIDPPWLVDLANRRIVLTVPGMKAVRITRNVPYRTVEGTHCSWTCTSLDP